MSSALFESICILLYLFVIFSPSELWEHEINQKEQENQQQVDAVRADQQTLDYVVSMYSPSAENVVVLDYLED